MAKLMVTKWLKLRAVLAVGVLALVGVELSGHRPWPVVAIQALLIVGIVITSVIDVVLLRRRGTAAPPSS